MRLFSEDEVMSVDVGTGSIWYSVYSTVVMRLVESEKIKLDSALGFLKTGECPVDDVKNVLFQMELIKDKLSFIPPDKAVYDLNKPDMAPPWRGNIAPTINSCADLYTTADGKNLFSEVHSLLEYALKNKVSVSAG